MVGWLERKLHMKMMRHSSHPGCRAANGRYTNAMLKRCLSCSALLMSIAWTSCALASSSAWFDAEGGRVRLITTGLPDDNGLVQGVLQIDLRPGWKTYWIDPGDAGVPPSVDVSKSDNVVAAELSFPAPKRFDDGFAKWAGYDHPVAFPVTFTVGDARQPATIEAQVFLGICETICIPVQATLTLDVEQDPANADDAADVDAARAALPGPEQPDFGVTMLAGDKDEVLVEAAFAGDPASAELFLAGSDGYQFAPPVRREEEGRVLFSVPILEQPQAKPEKAGLAYTLVTDAGAVSGILPYPAKP